jgi:hypothetical protein
MRATSEAKKVELKKFTKGELQAEVDRRTKIEDDIRWDVRTYQFRRANISHCCRCPFCSESGSCRLSDDFNEVMDWMDWTSEDPSRPDIPKPDWCPLIEVKEREVEG